MLPKKQRVSRKLFEAVFRSAATVSSPFFVLKVKKAQVSKFAFSVSAKICPKAVDRNKLRRRGYAAARNLLLQIKTPTICLFIIKKGAEKLTFQKLQEEIKNILQKAGILNLVHAFHILDDHFPVPPKAS
ncbi:MAG: ribonuclease P protein component [Candidatus Paceibacterota bacterium]|jgi:ribonuclease P protein component